MTHAVLHTSFKVKRPKFKVTDRLMLAQKCAISFEPKGLRIQTWFTDGPRSAASATTLGPLRSNAKVIIRHVVRLTRVGQ